MISRVRKYDYLWALLLLAMLLSGCSSLKHDPSILSTLKWKRDAYQILKPQLNLPLSQRMVRLPDQLMQDVIDNDLSIGIQSATDYTTRSASFSETSQFQLYLALLPDRYIDLMQDKLLAIFLVEGFAGAGLSDWVVDKDGKAYYYMILNPDLFRNSLDQWLTYREDSIFETMPEGSDGFHLKVKTHADYSAMLYALLHEGAHLMDYEYGITPVVEDLFSEVTGRKRFQSPFVEKAWSKQTTPLSIYDYDGRKSLNVYAIYPERGRISRDQAPRLFDELRLTPFISFYASTNWNEHLADYVMYWHIERHLLGKVTLQLWKGDELQEQYYPLLATLQPDNRRALEIVYGE